MSPLLETDTLLLWSSHRGVKIQREKEEKNLSEGDKSLLGFLSCQTVEGNILISVIQYDQSHQLYSLSFFSHSHLWQLNQAEG